MEDAFQTGIAFDHAIIIIIGVLREHLDCHDGAGRDLQDRRKRATEEPPVHAFDGGREMISRGGFDRARAGLRGVGAAGVANANACLQGLTRPASAQLSRDERRRSACRFMTIGAR